jgi:hypothetical protein
MAAIVVIAIGAVSQAHSWGPLDTGRIDLNHVPAVFVAAIVLVLGAVALAARLGRIRRPEAVVLPASLATVLVVTLVLFAADAVATDGWTAARQSISSLVGRDGCGAASDTEIALADPGRSTSAIRLAPGAATPWYPVSARPMGVFVRGPWNEGDALVVEWGVKTPSGAKALGSGSMDAGDLSPGRALARSRFVPDSAFPPRPRNADFVRFRSHPVSDTYMSVTPPVPYSWISLASVVGNSGTPSVVSPVLFAAMPCAALPVLSHGVAQPPAVLVDGNYGITVLNYSSPFVGLRTMLDVTRLPARSPAHQQPMDVYRVIVPPGDSIASAVEAGIE